jgi:hypothetical protein
VTAFFGRETGQVEVTQSVWDPIAGLSTWLLAFVGGYYLHTYVPMFVTHGRTRRESAIGAEVFGGVLVVLMAALATIGFALERALYAAGGQCLPGAGLAQCPQHAAPQPAGMTPSLDTACHD